MIDLKKDGSQLKKAIDQARERNIIIPTFKQMKNPEFIPAKIKDKLKGIGL
jgi:cysteine synthase A